MFPVILKFVKFEEKSVEENFGPKATFHGASELARLLYLIYLEATSWRVTRT